MAKEKTIAFVFKPAADNSVVWPCTIRVPLDGGTVQDQTLKARFRVLADDRLNFLYPSAVSLLDQVEKASTGNAEQAVGRRGNAGLLDDALVEFVDLPVAGGGEAPPDIVPQLRALPYVADGLVRGYFEMIGRRLEKN